MAVVQTKIGICNRALAHLAILKPIVSLSDTTREESVACNLFYDQTRVEVLRDFPWPFAWKYAPLVLVDGTEGVASTQDFQYAYRLPDDQLRVHRVLGADRGADTASRIPFSLGSDTAGGLLYTDVAPVVATSTMLAQPELEYTADVIEARFPPDFAAALAWKLAFYLAPALTAGDQFKLGDRAFQMYAQSLVTAESAAVREQQMDPAPESEFITVRN